MFNVIDIPILSNFHAFVKKPVILSLLHAVEMMIKPHGAVVELALVHIKLIS